MWPVFEIVLEGISELVEFVGSVLYSAPKGFLPVIILSFLEYCFVGRSLHVQFARSVASSNNMLLFYFSYKLVDSHCNRRR